MAKTTKPETPETIDDLPKVDECFIITPIGEFNSETYIKANGLIDSVIQPVLDEFNFKAVAAHHINKTGSINNQIIKHILEDKLAIVNLTGLNPNVMYELAVRHSARLPVVIMCEKDLTPRLPFDIVDQRTIFYADSLAGNVLAKQHLREMITVALDDKIPDNPIYTAASQASIFKSLDEDNPLKLIMEKIDRLESRGASYSNTGTSKVSRNNLSHWAGNFNIDESKTALFHCKYLSVELTDTVQMRNNILKSVERFTKSTPFTMLGNNNEEGFAFVVQGVSDVSAITLRQMLLKEFPISLEVDLNI